MKTVIFNSRVEPVKMGTMAQPADIFHLSKKGDSVMSIKLWLDNTENDINQVDDHWFTPLHWAAMFGLETTGQILITAKVGLRVVETGMGRVLAVDDAFLGARLCLWSDVCCDPSNRLTSTLRRRAGRRLFT